MSLQVRLLSPAAGETVRPGHTLAVIGFGDAPAAPAPVVAPVGMPSLSGGPVWEVWESSRTVTPLDGEFPMAEDGEFLFGALSAPDEGQLAAVTERLYDTMLRQVEATPYKRLLRVWHYIPQITQTIADGERYHLFNQGRQAALDRAPLYAIPPAASALGSETGVLTILFVAARETGIALENPRQVSAYQYPPQYGPRPRFSRAMLVPPILFISGTASIVGHESAHRDDLAAQTAEMIENLRTMLGEADKNGAPGAELAIKAYIRRPADMDHVRAALKTAFPQAQIICLQADICREELLVEAEATAFAA